MLNCLSGDPELRTQKWILEGKIEVLGKTFPIGQDHTSICYVEQDDALLSSLTITEIAKFTAYLSLPSSLPKAEKDDRVSSLINELNLQKIASFKIMNLSSGEKRRVSVLCQLLRSPQILLLDEPTSGLSITDSYDLISLLKSISVKVLFNFCK